MSPILKKFRHDLAAIGFLGFGLFIGLALLSYNPQDPSFNALGSGLKATNYCGLAGSFLSDLLYQFFGVTAWILVAGFVRMAVAQFNGENIDWKNVRWLWGALVLLNSAAMMGLYFPKMKLFQEQIFLGGLVGLGLSQGLIRVFNHVGVQVVLWSVMAALVVLSSEKSLQEISKGPRAFLLFLRESVTSLFVGLRKKRTGNKAVTKEKSSTSSLFFLDNKETPRRTKTSEVEKDSEKEKENGALDAAAASDDDDTPVSLAGTPANAGPQEEEQLELPGSRRRVVLKAKPPKKIENWKMPGINLLEDPPASRLRLDREELRRKADLLMEKLKMFKIEGQIVDAKPGPLVTLYELKPNPDVKISEISNLEDDLSLALASESVRVMGQIPGTDVVGIETANSKRETVFYKDLLAEEKFWRDDVLLPIALGKQANGDPKIENLRAMPHLLIAGTTGSGKSVFMRSIIAGMLFRHSPKTLRLVLIDPKMVDLADFKDVPHLALPHIADPKKAVTALRWCVREMDKRYRSLSKFGAAKIEVFNEKVGGITKDEIAEHEKANQEYETTPGAGESYYYQPLPFIVVIVDELADLMSTEKQNIEPSIQRLAQKARACGIHLIFATQTPRKEVVTGLIKSNFPGRVALKVSSPLDSRIILEETGAERLLPNGDMLFLAPGVNKPARHHGPYIPDKEITAVVKFWGDQSKPEFDPIGLKMLEGPSGGLGGEPLMGTFNEDDAGEEYDHIVRWATEQKAVSASLLQRRFQIGYPKAARFIEIMESQGVIGPANGSKPRQVLANSLK